VGLQTGDPVPASAATNSVAKEMIRRDSQHVSSFRSSGVVGYGAFVDRATSGAANINQGSPPKTVQRFAGANPFPAMLRPPPHPFAAKAEHPAG